MKIKGDSRAVEWDCNKEASKALLWVPRGTNQAVVKPVMGLGTGPVLTDTGVGHFNSVFSGPSLFEVGESALAGEGKSAQAQLTLAHPMVFPQSFDLEPEVSDQCTKLLAEADGPFSAGPGCLRVRSMAPPLPEPAPLSLHYHRVRSPAPSPSEIAQMNP